MASELPRFERGKTYLLTGDTLEQIMDWLRENKIVLAPDSGLKFTDIGPNGSVLDTDRTDECPS